MCDDGDFDEFEEEFDDDEGVDYGNSWESIYKLSQTLDHHHFIQREDFKHTLRRHYKDIVYDAAQNKYSTKI